MAGHSAHGIARAPVGHVGRSQCTEILSLLFFTVLIQILAPFYKASAAMAWLFTTIFTDMKTWDTACRISKRAGDVYDACPRARISRWWMTRSGLHRSSHRQGHARTAADLEVEHAQSPLRPASLNFTCQG